MLWASICGPLLHTDGFCVSGPGHVTITASYLCIHTIGEVDEINSRAYLNGRQHGGGGEEQQVEGEEEEAWLI